MEKLTGEDLRNLRDTNRVAFWRHNWKYNTSKFERFGFKLLFTFMIFIILFMWFLITANSYGMKHDLSFLQLQQIAVLQQMRKENIGKSSIEKQARRMIIDDKISKIFVAAPYVSWTQDVAKSLDSKIFTIHNENRIYVPFGVKKHILAADARVTNWIKKHPKVVTDIESQIPKKVQFVRVKNAI